MKKVYRRWHKPKGAKKELQDANGNVSYILGTLERFDSGFNSRLRRCLQASDEEPWKVLFELLRRGTDGEDELKLLVVNALVLDLLFLVPPHGKKARLKAYLEEKEYADKVDAILESLRSQGFFQAATRLVSAIQKVKAAKAR